MILTSSKTVKWCPSLLAVQAYLGTGAHCFRLAEKPATCPSRILRSGVLGAATPEQPDPDPEESILR